MARTDQNRTMPPATTASARAVAAGFTETGPLGGAVAPTGAIRTACSYVTDAGARCTRRPGVIGTSWMAIAINETMSAASSSLADRERIDGRASNASAASAMGRGASVISYWLASRMVQPVMPSRTTAGRLVR
jgi:hypothetical protein